jgi:hypothetical protein
LIVDTFNGGGWLHDDLNTLLSGKRYLEFAPRQPIKDAEPLGRWTKPSCVLMAKVLFRCIYLPVLQNGIGKLIGMGPGTGTAVCGKQIDPTLVFGIPMVATIGKENRPTENLQVNPDIPVIEIRRLFERTRQTIRKSCEEMLKPLNKMLILEISSKFKQRCLN